MSLPPPSPCRSRRPSIQVDPLSPSGSPPKRERKPLNPLFLDTVKTDFQTSQVAQQVTVLDTQLVDSVLQAKNMEWKAVFNALRQAFDACVHNNKTQEGQFVDFLKSKPTPNPQVLFHQNIERFLRQCYQHAKVSCPQDITVGVQQILQQIENVYPPSYFVLHDLLKKNLQLIYALIHPNLFAIKVSELSTLFDEFLAYKNFDRGYKDLLSEIETLVKLIKHNVQLATHYRPLVATILFKIRSALNSKAYKLCKTDESILSVQFLHNLCFAIYTNTEFLEACTFLGEKLYENTEVPEDLPVQLALSRAWERGAQHGMAQNDPQDKDTFWNRFKGSLQIAIDSYFSGLPLATDIQNFLTHLSAYLDDAKDYHGQYENNPGRLYEEQIEHDGQITSCQCVLTPSPIYGDRAVAEFLALLQAAENRHFQNVHTNPYYLVSYVCQLDKGDEREGKQTEMLMNLQEQYPFSFCAITVSPESFGSSLPAHVQSLSKDVKTQIYNALIAEDSFTLCRKHGFYFPPQDKLKWVQALRFIVDESYNLLKKQKKIDPKETLVAFSELVRLGIIYHFELSSLSKMPKNVARDVSAVQKAVIIRSCAVCVDRGAKVNTSFLWGLQDSELAKASSWTRFLASVFLGRAVLAKKRLPLPKRLDEMGILTKSVSQKEVNEFLKKIASNCQATSKGIRIEKAVVASSSSSSPH